MVGTLIAGPGLLSAKMSFRRIPVDRNLLTATT
ncbi:hypothetical protein J2X68_008044 [Streptomyces sp. 3330]|nr:hypothetical protein [Streptomyces sp. 3330]